MPNYIDEKFNKKLVVEGSNDQHFVWNLCSRNSIIENFDVVKSFSENKRGSIDAFEDRLGAESDTRTVAIVIDADESASSTWDSLRNILLSLKFPVENEIPADGYVGVNADDKKAGVWIMPNNQTNGELEDFIRQLIPPDDDLKPIAENTLAMIESEGKERYGNDRAKAFIHTWLAWQKEPGKPLGQAITARYLNTNTDECRIFVEWLNRVFTD